MSDQQHNQPARKPDRVPTLFASFIDPIRFKKRVWIIEHLHGIFEPDAVFPLVRTSLGIIPLEQ